jgi:hypothetical protein
MAPLVVNTGKAIITNRILGSGTEPKFVGWGTGTTAEAITQTTLITEAAPTTTTRVTGTSSQVTITTTSDTYQVIGTVTAGGTLAITETALFDNATPPGNMFMRAVFSVINVTSGDSIQFTLKVQFT